MVAAASIPFELGDMLQNVAHHEHHFDCPNRACVSNGVGSDASFVL